MIEKTGNCSGEIIAAEIQIGQLPQISILWWYITTEQVVTEVDPDKGTMFPLTELLFSLNT